MYAKDTVDLFLFCKLRLYAANFGGDFSTFIFTNNELYNVLPELIKKGWVTKDKKIVKYRKTLNKAGCTNIYTELDVAYLSDLDTFKGWLIAVAEKYCLDRNHKVNSGRVKKLDRDGGKTKVDWSYMGVDELSACLLKTEKIGFGDSATVSGRVFNEELVRVMGISDRSVTNWRKKTKVNTYEYKEIVFSRKKNCEMSNAMWQDRVNKRSVYRSKKYKDELVTVDMVVKSSLHLYKFNLKGKNKNSIIA